MRIVQFFKDALSKTRITSDVGEVAPHQQLPRTVDTAETTPTGPATSSTSASPSGIHTTPPGHWPKEGPKPSKIAIITYYLSVIATMIGVIVVIRSMFMEEDHDQPKILGIGMCMVTAGIALIIITNTINKCEHDRIMHYLEGKVEELRYEESSRCERNLRESAYLVPNENVA